MADKQDKKNLMAVIQTGGKQYMVAEGTKLKVELLPVAEGENVTFDTVLLTTDGEQSTIGQPVVKNASVEARVLRHTRAKKVFGTKHKAKKRYMRVFGHKQHQTEIEITKIAA